MDLTDEQIERYARHIVLKEVRGAGQQRLLRSKVMVVGAGGSMCSRKCFTASR
jgi:adenylyltransferase/sulfurtransferase